MKLVTRAGITAFATIAVLATAVAVAAANDVADTSSVNTDTPIVDVVAGGSGGIVDGDVPTETSIPLTDAAPAPAPATGTKTTLTTQRTVVAARTAVGKACTSEQKRSISQRGKYTHVLAYYACVDLTGSKAVVRGKWKSYSIPNRSWVGINQAPEFHWFDTTIQLEAGNRTYTGVCKAIPRPSDAFFRGDDALPTQRHYPFTCYFDKPQVAGTFYRASLKYGYDIKNDGLSTNFYTGRIWTPYLRG